MRNNNGNKSFDNLLKYWILLVSGIAFLMIVRGNALRGADVPAKGEVNLQVLEVEAPPGAWSGYVEFYQWFSARVTSSSDSRFEKGKQYRVGIPVTPGPLFEKDYPRFSSSAVAKGKRLKLDTKGDCLKRPEEPGAFKASEKCLFVAH